MQSIECSCDICRTMCATSTCLPTPDEARALIRAGYAPRLATYRFAPDPEQMYVTGPAPKGLEGSRELHHTMRECTFFVDGLCELHDAGLKPMEGRIAMHDRPAKSVRELVLSHWKGKQGNSVAKRLDAVTETRAI